MKKTTQSLLLSLACALLSSVARAAELPPQVAEALQARDQKLSRLTFDWQVSTRRTFVGLEPKQLAAAIESTAADAREKARRGGVTDAKSVDAIAKAAAQSTASGLTAYERDFSSDWRFTRNHDATLIEGDAKISPGLPSRVQYYYGPGFGVMVVNRADIKDIPADVWASPGDATHTLDRQASDLLLAPETFAMQVGTDPLAMYNAHWNLVATTPQAWILEGLVRHNDRADDVMRVMLSRRYGGAPVEIQVKGDRWTAEYQATRFIRRGDTWVCTASEYFEDRAGLFTYREAWRLKNVAASKPISLATLRVAPRTSVCDYRLGNSVGYRWSGGALPSLIDLTRMRQEQYPAGATPAILPGSPATGNAGP